MPSDAPCIPSSLPDDLPSALPPSPRPAGHARPGTFLGMIGFADPEGWPGFELAWTLARRWWGPGYATEGARAALAYAFTVLNQGRVISLIHPENLASIRVAERLGERLQDRRELLGQDRLRIVTH